MELTKKSIKMNCINNEATTQVTLDDDIILNDTKPDIDRIINERGTVLIDEVRPNKGKVLISGNLTFDILYFNDENRSIHNMTGSIPFKEFINMDNIEELDDIRLQWEIDDLAIRIVNSRKISIRAIINFILKTALCSELDVITDVTSNNNIYTSKEDISFINLLINKKDSMRIKEEIALEKNKPDIMEILWKNVNIRNTEVRPTSDVLKIKGEMEVFILYKGESDELVTEWQESVIPYSAEVEIAGIDENVIPIINLKSISNIVDARPDQNGEIRLVQIDYLAELEIKIYNEEQTRIVNDIYSTSTNIIPKYENAEYEELLVNNSVRSKFDGVVKHNNSEFGILQFICAKGEPKIDDIISEDGMLRIEGAIISQIMYITKDDLHPACTIKAEIPFVINVEAEGEQKDMIIDASATVDQIYATVIDEEHIGIRGNINANIFIRKRKSVNMITGVTQEDYNIEELSKISGITGYVVQKDDTLWDIAKKYHSSVDNIKRINNIQGDSIKSGDRIIIMKIPSVMLEP